MDKVSVSQKQLLPVVPLYKRLQKDHEVKSKLWYEQFSRKQIAQYASQNSGSLSEQSCGKGRSRARVSTHTFNNSSNKLRLPVHRHTDMNLQGATKQLDKVQEIDKINQEIRRLEMSLKLDNKALGKAKDPTPTTDTFPEVQLPTISKEETTPSN